MTRPRSEIVYPADTRHCHCVSRCVRRAFLCGDDRYSDRNFDHRKPWLVERMALPAEVFAIDIAACAVMGNRYHVVLHVDPARCRSWSRDEVIGRWLRLYKGDPLAHRHREGELRTEAEFAQLDRIAVTWRGRLADKKGFIPESAPPILSTLRLSGAQWRLLALEIQREAITMFNGLDKLAARERRRVKRAA